MIIVKLLAPVLVLLITALQLALDYKWHDKRTKLHRRTRKALLYILVITAVVTLIIVVDDTISANQQQGQLTALQDTLNKERLEAAQREEDAKKDRATLLSRLNEIHFQTVVNDSFKPLNPDARKIALDSITAFLNEEHQSEIKISISCDTGNRNRQLLAKEFTNLLVDAGANVKGPMPTMTFSNGILPTVRIKVNPGDEQLARRFVASISPMFRTNFNGVKDDDVEAGNIGVFFYGEPVFYPDGSVGFK